MEEGEKGEPVYEITAYSVLQQELEKEFFCLRGGIRGGRGWGWIMDVDSEDSIGIEAGHGVSCSSQAACGDEYALE